MCERHHMYVWETPCVREKGEREECTRMPVDQERGCGERERGAEVARFWQQWQWPAWGTLE